MAGNDDRVVGYCRDVGFRGSYLAVDAASGAVVDEGVVAVPEGVCGVENVGLGKIDGDVGVGVGGLVVLQLECGVVGVESVFVFEDGGGERSGGCGWEGVLPVAFDAGGFGEMYAGVLVGEDAGSGLMDPLVAAGVVEVPVGVDELFDGIGVDAGEGFFDVWTGGDDLGIDEQLSVRAGQDGDVSTSAQEDTDVAAEVLNGDLCGCGFLEGASDDLGEQVAWKAGCGGR